MRRFQSVVVMLLAGSLPGCLAPRKQFLPPGDELQTLTATIARKGLQNEPAGAEHPSESPHVVLDRSEQFSNLPKWARVTVATCAMLPVMFVCYVALGALTGSASEFPVDPWIAMIKELSQ